MAVVENNLNDNLKLCECGCGQPTKIHRNKPRRFIYGHWMKALDQKGDKHYNWKGGRKKHKGYWYLHIPDYFSSDSHRYVSEHVYFYQEYNKLCMLSWGHVHHIEPVTENYCNNMPWNLQGMTHKKHIGSHKIGNKNGLKDMSNRKCLLCDSKTTYIDKKNSPRWYKYKDGFICSNCRNRINNKKIYNKSKT